MNNSSNNIDMKHSFFSSIFLNQDQDCKIIPAIQYILKTPRLKKLLDEDPEANRLFREFSNLSDGDEHIETLRKLCMSIWLESINTLAIDNESNLLVDIQNDKLLISDTAKDKNDLCYRQAIIRQIERWVVMDAHGLFALPSNMGQGLKMLDIGAGTCINDVVMKNKFPNIEIDAVEPGIESSKTKAIVEKMNINFIRGEIKDVPETEYDIILLQFILEHDLKGAKEIIREALGRLSPQGIIAIAVPNKKAFHRKLEAATDNKLRDPRTGLSPLDRLIGHQIIFDQTQLLAIIRQAMNEKSLKYPLHISTILPRPCSFDTLVDLGQHKKLFEFERYGYLPGLEDQGSVLCVTIGNIKPVSILRKKYNPKRGILLFRHIIYKLLDKDFSKTGNREKGLKTIDYLSKNYPQIVSYKELSRRYLGRR